MRNFTTGLAAAGIAFTATDSSKTYPVETDPTVPAAVAATQYPPGAAFGTAGAGRQGDQHRPALSDQRLLQRLQAGPGARRVQLDLQRDQGLQADPERHDVQHRRRDLGSSTSRSGALDRLRPHHGQRPPAALRAPEQPRRLQPGAPRDRHEPGRHPLPVPGQHPRATTTASTPTTRRSSSSRAATSTRRSCASRRGPPTWPRARSPATSRTTSCTSSPPRPCRCP